MGRNGKEFVLLTKKNGVKQMNTIHVRKKKKDEF